MSENGGDLKRKAMIAEAWLHVEAARQYGLVSGGPQIDVAACQRAIEEARAAGLGWTDAESAEVLRDLVCELS